MSKYTKQNLAEVTARIEDCAKHLGLLPQDAKLTYHHGNSSQGISPELTAHIIAEDRQYRTLHPYFLPKLWSGYHTTRKEAYGILTATEDALRAVILHQEGGQS